MVHYDRLHPTGTRNLKNSLYLPLLSQAVHEQLSNRFEFQPSAATLHSKPLSTRINVLPNLLKNTFHQHRVDWRHKKSPGRHSFRDTHRGFSVLSCGRHLVLPSVLLRKANSYLYCSLIARNNPLSPRDHAHWAWACRDITVPVRPSPVARLSLC